MKVIVVGGGAAGIFGAIHCAELNQELQVTVLEAGCQLLGKVKISGGGRCNVTHHCFQPPELVQYYPRGGRTLTGAFTRFQPQDTIAWFTARGVKLKTETDGRVFPVTDDSQTIIDCLLNSATKAKVKLVTNTSVKVVEHINNRFTLELNNGKQLDCDRLLLATGSNPSGYRFAQHLGHSIQPPVPSLFTLTIKDQRLQGLAGLSVSNATITLNSEKGKITQTGPILITHWGLSGPAVLKLSAWGARILSEHNYKMSVVINWLPPENPESLKQKLLQLKTSLAKKRIPSFSPLELPKRLWQSLIEVIGIPETTTWSELSKQKIQQLSQELTQGRFQIQGKGVFKEEFVTCGGVSLQEIDFKTMESKICRGLYFAGEIIDIDGITGGFNFQNAWTTGWLAGKGIATL